MIAREVLAVLYARSGVYGSVRGVCKALRVLEWRELALLPLVADAPRGPARAPLHITAREEANLATGESMCSMWACFATRCGCRGAVHRRSHLANIGPARIGAAQPLRAQFGDQPALEAS